MRTRRITRVLMIALGGLAIVACGLDVIATGGGAGPNEGGPDGQAIDGSLGDGAFPGDSTPGDGGQIVLPPLPDPFDGAGLDASQTNCLAACDGGGCDAGWCVLDCATTGTCTNDKVACPPGIPCEVRCGQNSCSQGVDCTAASACRIDCAGDNSCANAPVDCSGLACKVDCAGDNSCSAGVTCDAGACTLGCLGDSTCDNGPVTCNAKTCTIRCGENDDDGKNSCSQGVTCETTERCDIGCVARSTCRNEAVVANSKGTSIVQCTGPATCTRGSVLTGGEAGVLCTGTGACGQRTYCDAGKCTASCEAEDFTFCCKGGAGVCNTNVKNCQIGAGGCPP